MIKFIGSTVLVVATLAAAMARVVRAEVLWMPVSYAQLIESSDAIVVGKIVQVARGVHDDGAFNCSRLQVTEVLKGTVPASGARLDYPCKNPIVLEGDPPPPSSPTDVFFEEGQEGVWFLTRQEDSDHFMANHPGRFRPLLFVGRVKEEIRLATPPRSGT